MQSVPPSLTMMPLDGMIARAFEVPGKSRLLPMEGMRGFSAALVFVVHLNTLFGELAPAGIRRIVEVAGAFGHCGVDVFFALSGFIIYGCLIEKPIQYRAFVKKRIARLYPVFGAVLGLYLVLIAITGRKAIPRFGWESAAYLLANFLLLPGILPITPIITAAWSLSYEMCFYVAAPLLIRGLNMPAWPREARIACVLALCSALLAANHYGIGQHPRLVMFGCGILLRETISRTRPLSGIGNLLVSVGFGGVLLLFGLRSDPAGQTSPSAILLAALFVSTYALVFTGLSGTGLIARVFCCRWLRWFGNISYSYYLTHGLSLHGVKFGMTVAVGQAATLSAPAFLLFSIGAFAITAIGGALTFLVIEKRFSFTAGPRRAVGIPWRTDLMGAAARQRPFIQP